MFGLPPLMIAVTFLGCALGFVLFSMCLPHLL